MSFNSFGFLLVFLPVCLIVYWCLRTRPELSKVSVWFLVVASLLFYGLSFPKGLPVLILSIVINYLVALTILKGNNKGKALTVGVLFDVLLLAVFKYGGLILVSKGINLEAPGISFYTFCEIAFLVECYRGTVEGITLREYMFLVSFFPKIIEGPIVRPKELLSQGCGKDKLSFEEIYRGIVLFTFGLFKKVVIAETLREAVDFGFSSLDSMHSGEALVLILSYTLQIYFDFSGYTDMAVAIASFLGFELPENFDSPYKARNICDFWKRWHISLTNFFTQYIYIPLGGNRKGKVRMYINFLVIFFVSGLWHGAGWQFIIWGMMHGILFVITRFLQNKIRIENKFLSFIGQLLTFIYVGVAWVFFRASSVKEALHLFSDFGQFWFPRFNYNLAKCFNIDELWYVIKILRLDGFHNSIYILMGVILTGLTGLVFYGEKASSYSKRCKINLLNTMIVALLLVWSLLSFEGVATYIYVNF